MKRITALLLALIIIVLLFSGCMSNDLQSNSTVQSSTVSEAKTETYLPEDLYGSDVNPFYSVKFPENFNVYSASFDIGNPKFDGKPNYILSMTSEGKIDESIRFLAKLLGIEDEGSINKYLMDFNKSGFCEFQSSDGGLCTIRKTDQNDDRYQYVVGCHIDLRAREDSINVVNCLKLIKDNYSINALGMAANYFDVTPTFDTCSVYLNRYKHSAEISMAYDLKEVGIIQNRMATEIKVDWYDSKQGKMGLTYGLMDISFLFDANRSQIYVSEKSNELESALALYSAPDKSLTKLGFYYSDKDGICLYEDKAKGFSVAIHKPEWGNNGSSWNLECLQEVNGYLLVIWYYAKEQKLTIQADKGTLSAKYDYNITTGTYENEQPDSSKALKHFSAVFGSQDDVYNKAVSLFNQVLQSRFSMNLDTLYALPIR